MQKRCRKRRNRWTDPFCSMLLIIDYSFIIIHQDPVPSFRAFWYVSTIQYFAWWIKHIRTYTVQYTFLTHTSCRGSAQDASWNTKSSWASILSLALCVNPVVKHLASLPVFIGLAGNSTPCSAVKKTSQLLLVWHLFSNWPCVYGLVVKPTFGLQWWLDLDRIPMKFIAALSSCQGCTCSVLVTNSPFAGETLNPQNICFSVW